MIAGHPVRMAMLAAVAATALLTGCQAPRPDVTFFADRTAIATAPSRWCEADVATRTVSCSEADIAAIPRVSLGPGDPVQINVPGAVGGTPWQVYFRYLDRDGQLADGRSQIFTDGRLAYTLHPFNSADQLTFVEVQSGFVLVAGETAAVDFAATRSWLLLVDPRHPAQQENPG